MHKADGVLRGVSRQYRLDNVKRSEVYRPSNVSRDQQVYLWLRNEILEGRLPPGTPLSPQEISKQLRVSRLPISAALRRFEEDGLFERKPRAGTRVAVPSEHDVRERYGIREALESETARLFVAKAKASDREELFRRAKHLDLLFSGLVGEGTSRELLISTQRYHFDFHVFIAHVSGYKVLQQFVEREQLILSDWMLYANDPDRSSQLKYRGVPVDFHTVLATGLVSANPARAAAAARQHVQFGLDEMVRALQFHARHEWRSPVGFRAASKGKARNSTD